MKSKMLVVAVVLAGGVALAAQGVWLDHRELLKPLSDSWPVYSGDYTGKRFSPLTQVDRTNVKHLTLAWTARVTAGPGGRGGAATIVGGEGTGESRSPAARAIKGVVLEVDGMLYVTSPDNAWAIDARDGRELWHYFWKTRGGTHIGNRGVGIWHNYLYFETPDDYLVSPRRADGQGALARRDRAFDQQYFSTTAPIVIGNHVLVGTGNDLDAPGFLQSFDPETGKLQWKFYTVPMNPGDPGPRHLAAASTPARHGGGQVVDAGRLRSGDAPLHLRHRQPDARLHGVRARQRRQPLHVLAHRRERRHRQDGVVLSDRRRTTRTTGIRRRRRSSSTATINGRPRKLVLHRRAQRLLLHAGPRDRRAPADEPVRATTQLGDGARPERRAGAEPGEGCDRARLLGLADRRRHRQLAAARVLARDRAASTCRRAQRLRDVLPDDTDPARRRWGSAGRRRCGVGLRTDIS